MASPQTQPLRTLSAALAQVPAQAKYRDQVVSNVDLAMPAIRALPPASPDALAAQFEAWRVSGITPLEPLLHLTPDESDACLMAACLAAVPSNLKYHNHHHTREVATLAMLLAQDMPLAAQREIFIAACIHDFGHDGQGNRRGARHNAMRLENQSLDFAHPYLSAAGLDEISWQRIVVMVLATDVSKDDASATSPAEWLRRAYKGSNAEGCPPQLAPLFSDKTLAHQAALLEDADLGTSAGLPYDHASRMTALIADETGVLAPTPQTLIGFLDHICHGAFITPEALALFGDNITALRARAVDETAETIYNWS
jgi:hypothetical protein